MSREHCTADPRKVRLRFRNEPGRALLPTELNGGGTSGRIFLGAESDKSLPEADGTQGRTDGQI